MRKPSSLLTDGVWVAALQSLSAVGQLLGVRLLTEVVPPSVFGEVSLWVGAIALISAALANPTMQALLRFYPEFHAQGRGDVVKSVALAQIARLGRIAFPFLGFLAIYGVLAGSVSIPDVAILFSLVAIDIARMNGLAYLNSMRMFKPAGIWTFLEAWGRPLLAYIFIGLLGVGATWVLLAYLIASLVVWGWMRSYVSVDPASSFDESLSSVHADLARRFWVYSIPLLPLGLIGWVSGMADRYMIGLLLTPADVGLYVAIYGLASRPMAMLGGVVETTVRPAYQNALASKDYVSANGYIFKWVALIVIGGGSGVLFLFYGHDFVSSILLGEQYRASSHLLPWIAGGYALLSLSHVANRVCYANEATGRVLLIEVTSAGLSLVIGFLCIKNYGLFGAAFSVPIYFGAQLAVSWCMAWPWLVLREGQG